MEIKGKIKKRNLNLYLIQWSRYLKLATSRSSANFSFCEWIEPCVIMTNTSSGKYSHCVTLMLQWKNKNWIRYKRYDFLHLWCMWIMEAKMTQESGMCLSCGNAGFGMTSQEQLLLSTQGWGGCSVIISEMSNFSSWKHFLSPRKKGDLWVFLVYLLQNIAACTWF